MSNFVNLTLLLPDDSKIVYSLVGSAMKTTVLLSFVALLCLLLRRRQAATRHLLWTLALGGTLALPLLSSTLNIWQVKMLPDSESIIHFAGAPTLTGGVEESERPAEMQVANKPTSSMRAGEDGSQRFILEPPRSSTFAHEATQQAEDASVLSQVSGLPHAPRWTLLVLGGWLAGVALLLIRLLVGVIGTWSLMNRGTEFDEGEWTKLFSILLNDFKLTGKARLLRSEHTLMPIVCGVLRPVVLLPASADDWSEERRRMVVLHELAHVARRDCLTQVMTQVACALYWFNPLVWYAARQSRVERERACDDYVLGVGAKPSDYAHHLLEIARSLRSRRTFDVLTIATVAMARRSQLEDRLLAILDKDGKTQTTPRVMTMGITVLLCFAVLSIAAVQPTTRAARNVSNSMETSDAQSYAFRDASFVSTLAAGLSVQSETANQEAARRAAEQKQKQKDENDEEVDVFTGTQSTEADIERNIAQDVEQDIERDVIEDTAGLQSTVEAPMPMLMPGVNPQINIHVNPDFKFRDDGENEQDERSERNGQSSDYIEELASVGYTNLSVNQLIQLKTHGVTAAYVKSLRALGWNNLSVNEISTLRIHGVTSAYVEAMRGAGFAELTPSKLATFRIHGVTPEYVKTMRDAGFSKLSANQLLAFRIHEVTPEFVAAMRAAGYPGLSPNQLTQARIMGVTPQFVRAARSRLGELTFNQIIALKQTGIIKDVSEK